MQGHGQVVPPLKRLLRTENEVPGEAAQTLVTALGRNVKHEDVGVTVNATARNSVPI
jgi:hypothetical protein